jgi:hypothetical protein
MPYRRSKGATSQDVRHSLLLTGRTVGSTRGVATLGVQAAHPSNICQGKQARRKTSPWGVPTTFSFSFQELETSDPLKRAL